MLCLKQFTHNFGLDSEEALNAPLPKSTIYDYIVACNKQRKNRVALNYFGNKINYDQMFFSIDRSAEAFCELGVKAGDTVTLCMLTMPETVYSVYALNHLGAICNIIEPRTNSARIRDRINEVGSTVLVVVDVFLSKILDIADQTKLQHIIVVPISLSMGLKTKFAFQLTKGRKISRLPHDPRYQSWTHFIGIATGKEIQYPAYQKDTPAVIIYTGGTTGISKGAVLTNDSITAMALQSV